MTTGNKEQITVLECGNAAGAMCPPGVLFSGKKEVVKLTKSAPSKEWGVFFSPSGWMNGHVFEEWFTSVYLPWISSIRGSPDDKVLLLLDGHKSHETIEMLDIARANNVIVYCMSANMTHVLQPLDVSFFKSLQSNWDKVVHSMATEASKRCTENQSGQVSRDNFCQTFEDARNRTIAGPADDEEPSSTQSSQSSQSSNSSRSPTICRSLMNGFRYVKNKSFSLLNLVTIRLYYNLHYIHPLSNFSLNLLLFSSFSLTKMWMYKWLYNLY